MLLLLGLKLCRKLQKESQLEYCVQEPNEVCIRDGGPPIVLLVRIDIGTCLGIINFQTS